MKDVPSTEGVRIRRASQAIWEQALSLVFRDEPADVRLAWVRETLLGLGPGDPPREHLLVACRGEQLVGAAWARRLPGRIGTVWPPRLVGGEPESTASRLLDELDGWLRRRSVDVAYALLPSPIAPDSELLASRQFRHLADLLYLSSCWEQFPLSQPEGPLRFVPYTDSDRERLSQLIEETYCHTLDMPALNGLRQTEDVLEGYRHTGVFEPGRWLWVVHRDQAVGCLLLTDHPQPGHWELMYMGLVPQVRGSGFGLQIARHAQWLARRAGREILTLAVDSRNGPAVATYAKAGFAEFDRRSVFLKAYTAGR